MIKLWKKHIDSVLAKLIILIIISIIPLNVLIVILSYNVIDSMNKSLQVSYERELETECNKLDADIEYLESELASYQISAIVKIRALEVGDADRLVIYSLWKDLKNIMQKTEFFEAGYIKTKWENEVYLTHNNKIINNAEADGLKRYLKQNDLTVFKVNKLGYFTQDDNLYFVLNYEMDEASIGFIIRGDSLYSELSKIMLGNESIQILDSTGNMIDSYKKNQSVTKTRESAIRILQSIQSGEYTIVREIPRSSISPATQFLETMLKIIAGITLLIIPFALIKISGMVVKPLNALKFAMSEIQHNNLRYRMGSKAKTSDFRFINEAFNDMAEEINNLRIKSYEKEIEKLQIEAVNIRLQVSPHMLLNSLNVIYSLAQSNKLKTIQTYTLHLVKYFRYALRTNDQLVPIQSEIEFITNYLEIQKLRFPEAFTCVYVMDEGVENYLIPPLLIQNFVENSIKHGILFGRTIEIILIVAKETERIRISINDTGAGMNEEVLQKIRQGDQIEDKNGSHIGIWNCRRRIKMFYGDDSKFSITSIPGEGTQVWMELPVRERMDKHESANR